METKVLEEKYKSLISDSVFEELSLSVSRQSNVE
jgi:hypothetical protein